MSKDEFTREQLVSICERAIVPENEWGNRDSGDAHRQLGEAWALLKAGCPYRVLHDEDLNTNDKTIWLEISYDGFGSVESGEHHLESETFYLPTEEHLKREGDWY